MTASMDVHNATHVCPQWCNTDHSDETELSFLHYSATGSVPALCRRSLGRTKVANVRIASYVDGDSCGAFSYGPCVDVDIDRGEAVEMSADEAEAFARLLLNAAAEVRANGATR